MHCGRFEDAFESVEGAEDIKRLVFQEVHELCSCE